MNNPAFASNIFKCEKSLDFQNSDTFIGKYSYLEVLKYFLSIKYNVLCRSESCEILTQNAGNGILWTYYFKNFWNPRNFLAPSALVFLHHHSTQVTPLPPPPAPKSCVRPWVCNINSYNTFLYTRTFKHGSGIR
jgi:hypothetical protein